MLNDFKRQLEAHRCASEEELKRVEILDMATELYYRAGNLHSPVEGLFKECIKQAELLFNLKCNYNNLPKG